MPIDLGNVFDPREIWKARNRIQDSVYRTPLVYSDSLSNLTDSEIYIKPECWQRCGCFKVRGAVSHVSSLTKEKLERGLVTASSGNHALAVAFASTLFGNPPTRIYVPEDADPAKVKRITEWEPELVYHGNSFFEAYKEARRYEKERGAVFVHSHGDPLVIAGQGTIGLEVMEDLPDVDSIIIPIGGGGLVSGVSIAAKTINEIVRIIGVEPNAAPGAYTSLRDGVAYEEIEIEDSIADGLLGGFGSLPFQICSKTVDETHLVSDAEIIEAMKTFQREEQLMVEAASSVGLAALMTGKVEAKGEKVVLIVTSRNIAAEKYNQLINS
jgi:threonine dehydratase